MHPLGSDDEKDRLDKVGIPVPVGASQRSNIKFPKRLAGLDGQPHSLRVDQASKRTSSILLTIHSTLKTKMVVSSNCSTAADHSAAH